MQPEQPGPVTISVIVPVYNLKAAYHKECFDSILAQTFTGFELILVDDGSTDGSAAMCDEYAAADSRVRVIHQQNKGVGSALDAGLDAAQGSYITFIDSDDYVDRDYLQTLYEVIIREQAAMVSCSYRRINTEGELLTPRVELPVQGRIPALTYIKNCLNLLHRQWFYWPTLYRADFIQKEHIRFTQTQYTVSVQEAFFLGTCYSKLAEHNEALFFITEPLHTYRVVPESISHNPDYRERQFIDMYPVHKLMIANRCSKYILLAWCLHYILTYALYDPRLRKQKKLLVCALWDAFIKSGQPMIFALWLFILVLPWSAVVGSYQIYCKIIRPALLKK